MSAEDVGVGAPGYVEPQHPPIPRATTEFCIRMRGLPWTTKEAHIHEFFEHLAVSRVAFLYDRAGKPKGEAFVYFSSDDMARSAMSKDRQYLGHRFIECYLTQTTAAEKLEAQSQDQTKGSLFIRLRGLPFSAKESGVMQLLQEHSIQAVEGSCIVEFGPDGRHSGCACVKLVSPEEADRALEKTREMKYGSRYVEVFKATLDEAKQLQKTVDERGVDGYVVKLRGLPMTADEAQVLDFLQGVKVLHKGIHMVDNDYGRANGTCFVELIDEADLDAAIAKDEQMMGTRYIEVHRSTRVAMSEDEHPPLPVEDGPFIVWLRGLPFTVTGVDVVKQLFPDLDIAPQGTHLVLEDDGRSHGQAYVELANRNSYEAALERTGRLMGKSYAQQAAHTGRKIDIIPSSDSAMNGAGFFVDEEVVTVKRRHPQEILGCQLDGVLLAGVADGSALSRHGGEQFVGRVIKRVNDIDITSPGVLSKALSANSTAETVQLTLHHNIVPPHRSAHHIREVLAIAPNCEWAKKWMAFCTASAVSCDPSPYTVAAAIEAIGMPPHLDNLGNSSEAYVGRRINLAQRQRDVVAKVGRSIMMPGDFENVREEENPYKYTQHTNLLLIGEGNFSYAASLCRYLVNAPHVLATGYDDLESAMRLPDAEQNIAAVRDQGGAVMNSVDATKLHLLKNSHPCEFDAIRWNNPHSGAYPTGAANVESNQCLLESFLVSALDVLKPGGEIHIVSSQHSLKKWRIEEMGANVVQCVKVERHNNPFNTYLPQRSRGGVLPDAVHTYKIYTFRRASEIASEHGQQLWKSSYQQLPPTARRPSMPAVTDAPHGKGIGFMQGLVGSPIVSQGKGGKKGIAKGGWGGKGGKGDGGGMMMGGKGRDDMGYGGEYENIPATAHGNRGYSTQERSASQPRMESAAGLPPPPGFSGQPQRQQRQVQPPTSQMQGGYREQPPLQNVGPRMSNDGYHQPVHQHHQQQQQQQQQQPQYVQQAPHQQHHVHQHQHQQERSSTYATSGGYQQQPQQGFSQYPTRPPHPQQQHPQQGVAPGQWNSAPGPSQQGNYQQQSIQRVQPQPTMQSQQRPPQSVGLQHSNFQQQVGMQRPMQGPPQTQGGPQQHPGPQQPIGWQQPPAAGQRPSQSQSYFSASNNSLWSDIV